jgi:hypothetical protein
MRFSRLLLSAAVLASLVVPASATMRIAEDHGGQIGQYLQAYALMRSSGENIVIDGNCLSACTLVLGLIPRNRICATHNARLGFHAAWMPGNDGHPVTSALGTQALWNIYPGSVQHWINRHGGLSRHMIFLQGRELYAFVPSCERQATGSVRLHSAHNAAPRHNVSYIAANAARDRR